MNKRKELIKVKDHKDLARDPSSKAILHIDEKSLNEHRRKKDAMKRLYFNESKRIESLETDMNEMKEMLSLILQKLN